MEKIKFGETRDYEPRSDAHMLEDFIEGVVWSDMKSELSVWMTEIRDLLEDPNSTDLKTNVLRGSLEAIRNMLDLPEILASNMRTDKKADAEKEEHDDEDRV